MPRLRRASCAEPGLSRRRAGKGFVYLDPAGRRIDDPETLQRIKDLGIPPAWTDVWICMTDNGHLQAVGTDAAGRKQYLYHSYWRQRRDAEKFDKMLEFAQSLRKVRHITTQHLEMSGMPRERVLACAVRLLDRGFFRIGGESYAETNETFGLATIRKEHVKVKGREVAFEYIAKSGKEQYKSIVDPEVFDVVAALKRRRSGSPELLAYKAGREWRDVKSSDINLYLKELAGREYSAKDFRTWHGTVIAAKALAVSKPAMTSRSARKRAVSRAMQEVAHYLGNTPTVCRQSYVDPRIVDRYESGWTILPALERFGFDEAEEPELSEMIEDAVIDLLQERARSRLVDVDKELPQAS